ncbi:uncharacterized protein CCOS01_08604, partial [Colletotrichum costaricense]
GVQYLACNGIEEHLKISSFPFVPTPQAATSFQKNQTKHQTVHQFTGIIVSLIRFPIAIFPPAKAGRNRPFTP